MKILLCSYCETAKVSKNKTIQLSLYVKPRFLCVKLHRRYYKPKLFLKSVEGVLHWNYINLSPFINLNFHKLVNLRVEITPFYHLCKKEGIREYSKMFWMFMRSVIIPRHISSNWDAISEGDDNLKRCECRYLWLDVGTYDWM